MINPVAVVASAMRLWWEDLVPLVALNGVWFLLQLPIVTGPPATATVFAMAQQSYDHQYWGARDAWAAFRELFWPAWRWALINSLILIVAGANIYAYRDTSGVLLLLLRLVWIVASLLWLAINLFYWPFWLAQEKKSMRLTYGNCGRFILLNPAPFLIIVVCCALLSVASVLTTLPFTGALACWLALIGVTAVQSSMAAQQTRV